ncbi:expansin EXLX1 family cellulose-binding protein [Streptomyces sp. G-G2]|uniref:expansin EXLX1 family cellulose-binding protein n=1 Tax=Streptomyces sp. G-G2 TaxID=3046201 RepID=UPI0024BB43C7|nr:expansin EXLX1 family cellulose-binding protein [Streptomyces sp. G-G2]MDJ0385345.1 expansin EXLX1 family cellulose-binding protein [Streptomyces sp. G-G2]
MKATKHAAPQPWRRRGLIAGIPLVLLAVGVLVCVVLTSPTGGGAMAGRALDPSAGATAASRPPVAGSDAAEGTGAAGQPTAPTSAPPPSSAAPSPSVSAGVTPPVASATSPASAVAASPGRIKPGVSYHGVATAYAAGDGNGSCLYGPSDDLMVAAMNFTDYEVAKACGAYVQIHAANGASLTVRIVNVCPLPCAPGQIDLSQQAFAKLAELSVGRLPITWKLLSPEAVGTVSVRYKTGSNRWWCGIQVIGHRNPLATLEVRAGDGWRKLPRADFNHFLSTDGTGCGGPIRMTDIYGEQLTVDRIAIKPDVAQPTSVQFARH